MFSGGHHELCGPAGRPGAGDGEGAVQGHQPGHPLWLHRRGGGAAEGWHLPVLALPRALWKAGCAALQGESGECQRGARCLQTGCEIDTVRGAGFG